MDIGRLGGAQGREQARRRPAGRRRADDVRRAHRLAGDPLRRAQDALPSIGDVQVRNLGTVGGAVAHADPASDLPAALLALGAEIVLQSARGDADRRGWTGSSRGRSRRRLAPTSCSTRVRPRPLPDDAGVRVRLARAAGVGLLARRRRGRGHRRRRGRRSRRPASASPACRGTRTGRRRSRTPSRERRARRHRGRRGARGRRPVTVNCGHPRGRGVPRGDGRRVSPGGPSRRRSRAPPDRAPDRTGGCGSSGSSRAARRPPPRRRRS